MKRSIVVLILILICSGHGQSTQTIDVRILSQSETSLVVEFTPRQWRVHPLEGTPYQQLDFIGAQHHYPAGHPDIPSRSISVGVPATGPVDVQLIDSDSRILSDISVAPVPTVERQDIGVIEHLIANDSLYQSSLRLPGSVFYHHEPTRFRNQRVLRIQLNPLQVIPAQNRMIRYDRLVVQISFPSTQPRPFRPESVEDQYKNMLINYKQARSWRVPDEAVSLRKTADYTMTGDNWFKIIIPNQGWPESAGLYKLTGETLQDAGISLSAIDPATLQLFNNGGRELPLDLETERPDDLIELPIKVAGAEDDRFDPQDYIVFYGQPVEGIEYNTQQNKFTHELNVYTDDNVYWLTFGKETGERIQGESSLAVTGLDPHLSFRDLAYAEPEQYNYFNSGRVWFGPQLARDRSSWSVSFEMPGALPGNSAQFRFRVIGASSGTHRFSYYCNENSLGEQTFSGGSPQSYSARTIALTDSGVLLNGQNTLTVQYNPSSDISIAYVDWVEVEYDRELRAVDDQIIFHQPVQDGPHRYRLTGFSRDDITILDITEPDTVHEIIDTRISNGTVEFADTGTVDAPRRYIAFTPGAFRAVSSVTPVELADLREPREADFIIISHSLFHQQAMQLASLRETLETNDRLETEVVDISSVFDEFGWGLPDPTAIRDFLVYAQDHWGDPRYVLLFGDGHFDYKNTLGYDTPNLIPPYETDNRHEMTSRTTDDWFTYTRGEQDGMQIAIGRIPVQTVADAQAVVDKIIAYETSPDYGEWRKTITVVGDDELVAGGEPSYYDMAHIRQSETLAEYHVPDILDVKKIYLTEYPAVRNASVSGVTKPLAKDDLLNQINRGSLIVNYIGHGNDELWSHERVLTASTDADRIQNGKRMALWVAATCEFAWWDQPQKQSFAERILYMQNRGAIALISSSRLAESGANAAFNNEVYDQLFASYMSDGQVSRLGDAVMMAKRSSFLRYNSEKYGVFGDPTLRLAAPKYRAVLETIEPDSIQALRKTRIQGTIQQDNSIWSEYQGKVQIRVEDSQNQITYESEIGPVVTYTLSGNRIFRGIAPVNDGRFKVEFIVPKDISYGGDDGRISVYFWNDQAEGTGYRDNLPVGGTAVDLVDHTGPHIQAHFGKPGFVPGDYTSPNPTLHVDIRDSLSGVNIAGDIGHQIMLTLDQDESSSKDITEFFQYDEGSYTKGSLDYPLYQLEPGRHDLSVKAWDNSNNSSTLETHFVVVQDTLLRVRNLLNTPNPMTDETTFSFEVSRDGMAELKLYTVSGRLLRSFNSFPVTIGFNTLPSPWDGTDQDGDRLANGVYLYKLKIRSHWNGKTTTAEKLGKLIIAR